MPGGRRRADGSPSARAAILDRLPASAAVIGRDGAIQFVNRAWREFGLANGRDVVESDLGRSYVECGDTTDADARKVATGVDDVIRGSSSLFTFAYACNSPDEQRWFECIVVPLEHRAPRSVLTIHMPVGADTAARLRRAAEATSHRLTGLVMVCAWCAAKELSLTGDWVDHDPAQHPPSSLSHGICPDCALSFR